MKKITEQEFMKQSVISFLKYVKQKRTNKNKNKNKKSKDNSSTQKV